MSMSGRSSRYVGSPPLWQRGGRGRGSATDRRQSGARISANTVLTNEEPEEKLLLSIHPELEITTSDKIKATIEDCQYVASYNWLDGKASTILVPGSPPTWTPPKRAVRLSEDNGIYYRDKNAARYSAYPIEPAIRALLKANPDYDCPTVDIVGCGSTLGSLLSACHLSNDRTFKFGVERLGNTIFLVRQTPPQEVIENVRGYGHSFPEAYTTWPRDVKGSASHQRLVEYKFADLRFLIRSESDGYLPEKMAARDLTDEGKARILGEESFEEATDSLAVSHPVKAASKKLLVRSSGQKIPQKAIFDLKTRSIRSNVNMDEFFPRLWVNQTPNFIIARHDAGVFKEIKVKDISDDVRRWELDNQKILLRLHGVLNKLIKLTSQVGCSRVQVRRMESGPLLITKPVKEWTVLPADLKARWEGGEASEGNARNVIPDESDSEDENEDYLKF